LDIVQTIWAALGKLFAPPGVPSWLRLSVYWRKLSVYWRNHFEISSKKTF